MRIVDISHAFADGMPGYPAAWYPRLRIFPVLSPDSDPTGAGRTFTRVELFAHNATHIDAPRHFLSGGAGIGDLDPGIFVGPAVVADLSDRAPRQPVTGEDLEQAVGAVWEPGLRLLIRTDYLDRHWGAPDFWEAAPYLTPSAAEWAVRRGARLVGLDCQTERPGERNFPVHRILLGAGIPILEYVRNLAAVRSRRVTLLAAPVLIQGVEAAPARALVVEGGEPLGAP